MDTKYEFGTDSQGTIRLIDEIHTPDCSRYTLRPLRGLLQYTACVRWLGLETSICHTKSPM